jgi:uncharacterized repeat protein (TIGR01451 family)
LVTNIATISANGDTFERQAMVMLVPTSLPPHLDLHASYKTASQYILTSGDTLTYTIRLHNSGTVTATATVTDRVSVRMNYVSGSATEGGVYDAGTRTLSWSNVTVPAGGSKSLSFAATATAVGGPTPVVNRATITAGSDSFERMAIVLVTPGPTDGDVVPPVVHGLTIDEQDVLAEPAVTLHISATDNVSVTQMYLREWQWMTAPMPHWETVKSSGWVPYQADYLWTLGAESGTHFVGVWVKDDASNVSHLNRQALDFASLLMPGETLPRGRIIPYQVYYEEGVNVSAVLAPTAGDADLYVWYPGHFFWPPDQKSVQPGTATDEVSFTTPRAGTYLFLVHAYTAATYNLDITPGGGPRALRVAGAYNSTANQVAPNGALLNKPTIQTLVTALFASGLDPLSSPAADGPFELYLPMIVR